MSITVNLTIESDFNNIPNKTHFTHWIEACFNNNVDYEIAIIIIDKASMRELNLQYRGKDAPTNVLSFPTTLPDYIEMEKTILGDIFLCAPIVFEQAQEQGKATEAHFAHLTVHGILHLLGYDHIKEEDAAIMEPLEIAILQKLGLNDPYII
jgi:probable rRNA maturation factor